MKKRNIFLISILLIFSGLSYAQVGSIRGQVIDDQSGEPLIGATVLVAGTTTGSPADLDGKFTLPNLQPGKYNIQTSFISYQTLTINEVEVKAGEVTILNIRLKTESVGLQEVVIEAKVQKSAESAMLTVQKKSGVVLDAISSEQFSRSGDSDAAAAMRRVTGISVEGGKYVYVRGLGDRYSKTAVNNAEIPGLDPNKNTVQMDLFPSNLIDNIVVYKTFSPELPGSFTGGFVNVATKDFPNSFTMQVSGSMGYNTNATFNNEALTHDLGKTHYLGFGDKNRDLPEEVKNGVSNYSGSNSEMANALDKQTKSFTGKMGPSRGNPKPNHSFSFSIGDQKPLFGKPLGFIAGLSYQRNYEHYDNGTTGRYFLPGNAQVEKYLDTTYHFNDIKSTESVLWGGLANISYKLNDRNKIGINLMRNQSTDESTRYQQGLFPSASGSQNPDFQLQLRSMMYTERSLNSGQLKGDHAIGTGKNPVKIDWIASYTKSTQDEPDLRFFNNVRNEMPDGSYVYDPYSNNITPPSRYFRYMDENNLDVKLNVEVPFNNWGLVSKIKFGGAYLTKERNFTERVFQFRAANPSALPFNGNPDDFFAEENLGIINQEGNRYEFGLFVREEQATGTYLGEESVPAGYAMVDFQITNKLKVATGVRFEQTDIYLENADTLIDASRRTSSLKRDDFLPAANVTYQLKKDMNLRFGYGRTIARPTFRELANYVTFDFAGDNIDRGNPNLERTVIDNLDLRWEVFPKSGELISISAFYKKFKNPIERAVNPLTTDLALERQFRNVDEANVYGLEFEVRKNLDFITQALDDFKLGANITVLKSEVDINEGELALIRNNDPEASDKRPMYGQAPYIVNSYLSYDNSESGITANVNFNVSGERLSIVGVGGTPNVFERPVNMLDASVGKSFANGISVRLKAQNLLDAEYKFSQEFKNKDYVFQSYKIGRTFSLSLSYLIH